MPRRAWVKFTLKSLSGTIEEEHWKSGEWNTETGVLSPLAHDPLPELQLPWTFCPFSEFMGYWGPTWSIDLVDYVKLILKPTPLVNMVT